MVVLKGESNAQHLSTVLKSCSFYKYPINSSNWYPTIYNLSLVKL